MANDALISAGEILFEEPAEDTMGDWQFLYTSQRRWQQHLSREKRLV